MYDEPDETPAERAADPATRAHDKFDEFRMHAELAATFEGHRKFDAELLPGLDPQVARDVQRGIGRLEKARVADSPFLSPASAGDATALLELPQATGLSTNDYHLHRRPGEVMVVRWLAGDQVQTFYDRLQAHFDAALGSYRDEGRAEQQWKPDPAVLAYLDALDAIPADLAKRAHRDAIRQRKLFSLATQTADEMNIAHLADYIMGVSPAELVGSRSAPPADPTDADLAWFFKLFLLRGTVGDAERMCCFAFLQKTDDTFGDD